MNNVGRGLEVNRWWMWDLFGMGRRNLEGGNRGLMNVEDG